MNRLFSGRSDMPFALLLLAPSLLLLGGLVAWPMVSNIEISFLRLPLNPNIESTFVGVSNYVRILSDPGFWHSLWMTVWYTALVVAGSTVLGLAVAMSGLISVFVYCFMVAWNDYLFASIFLSSASNFTLPVGLNALFSTPDYIWGRMMAASLVTALPVVIMYALSERFIKSGLTAGGVKG